MNRTIRLVIALAALVIGVQAWAQVDTNNPYSVIYGRLVKATSTELTLDGADAAGNTVQQVVTLNQSTMVDGCSIEEVVKGTQLLVFVAERSASGNVASYVKFYGCEPNWQFSGKLVTNNADFIELEGREAGGLNQDVGIRRLRVTSETIFATCYGAMSDAASLSVGTDITVSALGEPEKLRATLVTTQDDCGEARHVEGTFVSFADSTVVINTDGQSDPLRLFISDRIGRPYMDSLHFIYTCSGDIVRIQDIQAGDRMSIIYLSLPRQGDYLQYAQLLRNCPFEASGTITRVDGQSITILANGKDYTARLTDKTELYDCNGLGADASKLTVGTLVAAVLASEGEENTVLRLKINQDCPYAYYVGGNVTAVNQTSITIDGQTSEGGSEGSLELNFDAASLVLDCVNQPLAIDNLRTGSYVLVYYRTSGTQRVADLVTVQTPCDVQPFYGIVLNANESSITVSQEDGTTIALAINADSKLTDCNGATIDVSSSLVGTKVSGSFLTTAEPKNIQWATFNVGCPVILTDGGIITQVSDSTLTFQGVSGPVELQRSEYTVVYDALYAPTEWSKLNLGDTVCAWYDDGSKLAYRVLAGVVCAASEDNGAKPIIGTVVESSEGELTIQNGAVEMSFALTSNTDMTSTSNAAVSASDLSSGMRVSVMSANYNRRGQPVASSVTVMMSPTSVDEESNSPAVTLSPNPASDFVTFGNHQPGETVVLYDQRGNRVLRTDAPTVNVSTLAPGIYSVVRSNGAAVRLVIVR